eukprot:scaffold9896_cov90-Isochrysis_galbana.AAC.2
MVKSCLMLVVVAGTAAALRCGVQLSGRAVAPRMARAAIFAAIEPPGSDDEEEVDLGTELERQLRKALSEMDVSELRASDERVLDSVVEQGKKAFDQVEEELGEKFDAMQVLFACPPDARSAAGAMPALPPRSPAGRARSPLRPAASHRSVRRASPSPPAGPAPAEAPSRRGHLWSGCSPSEAGAGDEFSFRVGRSGAGSQRRGAWLP